MPFIDPGLKLSHRALIAGSIGVFGLGEYVGIPQILKDPERFPLIRKAWDWMLTGNYVPSQILDKLNNEWGFRTRKWKKYGDKPMSRSTINEMQKNSSITSRRCDSKK